MSSQQSEDHQNRSTDQSNDNHQQPTTASQPPNQPPLAMGYPAPPAQIVYTYPAPGHGHAPYPGYPPPPPHDYNQYPYAQAPPGGGGSGPYYTQAAHAFIGQDACTGFARGIILALVFVTFLTFLSSIITWAILRPQVPVFKLDKMTVSNFNTDKSPFTANWDAIFTIQNTNRKLRLYLDKIVATIYYDKEDSIASTWVQSVFMETQTNFSLNVNVSASGSAEEAVPIWIEQEMRKDRAMGLVSFALRLRIVATFKSNSLWTRSLLMRIYCENLNIVFNGDSPNGALARGSDGKCEIYA